MLVDRKSVGQEVELEEKPKAAIQQLQLVTLGLPRSGKTQIINSLCGRPYCEEYKATFLADPHAVVIQNRIKLDIIDPRGSVDDHIQPIIKPFLKNRDVALLCFDGHEKFEDQGPHLHEQLVELKECSPKVTVFCVLTKSDSLHGERMLESVKKFAADNNLDQKNVFQCSAKTGEGLKKNSAFINRLVTVGENVAQRKIQA